MVLFPPAKINLGLEILSKRADGYHSINSIFIPTSLTDVLELIPSNKFSFASSGLKIQGSVDSNLVVKAYELMRANYQIAPVTIHLHKNIPMGAGLGGGSADGAFTILGLNQIYNLNLSKEKMAELALEIGSDCPFFIYNSSCLVQGRGEVIQPISENPIEGLYLKLVNPGIHIGTAEAYAGISPRNNHGTSLIEKLQHPRNWSNELKNDFEAAIFQKNPSIKLIKEELYQEGAIYVSMTGSGSTMYGLFENKPTKTFANYYEWIGEN